MRLKFRDLSFSRVIKALARDELIVIEHRGYDEAVLLPFPESEGDWERISQNFKESIGMGNPEYQSNGEDYFAPDGHWIAR